MERHELIIDVTDDAALGEPAHIAVTVHLPAPESIATRAVVCFAKPGAGFSRGYFTCDLPGPARGAQAEWHAERGWIFVSVDHPGVGDSSAHHDPARLTFAVVARANHAAEKAVMERLASGTLAAGFPPIRNPFRLGIGHSLGGCLTVFQQSRYRCYDGLAVLGFSALHNQPPSPPGENPIVAAWRVPGENTGDPPILLNEEQFTSAFRAARGTEPSATDVLANRSPAASEWLYYYDDVREYFEKHGRGEDRPWLSPTKPGCTAFILTPGIVAPEAAAVSVPVLVAAGERDVVVNLEGEPRAYLSASSVDLVVCPRMGHMHNFSGTREVLWQRIHHWAQSVACSRGI